MSVVDRFRKRKVVSATVDIKLSGVTLKIARIAMMELEKATKQATKELAEAPPIENDSSRKIAFVYARCAAIGQILKDHVKEWDLADADFNKENVNLFWSELTYEERAELGLEYISACESDREDQKKTCEIFLQILRNSSKTDSPTNSETTPSPAESALSQSEGDTSQSPNVGDPGANTQSLQ